MTEVASTSSEVQPPSIRQVPQDGAVRDAVRGRAARAATGLDPGRPPTRADLERSGARVLEELSLPRRFLGFAMVAVSNAFWRPLFEAIPFDRRLLFLPACLRNRDVCKGQFNSIGLDCVGCSDCTVRHLKGSAESLGYRVLIAEGTPAVVMQFLECDADAVIGVACLESLEKAFGKVTDIGLPCMALPLLKDGCVDTVSETDHVLSVLRACSRRSGTGPRTYAPLLRESLALFRLERLPGLLAPEMPEPDARSATDTIAADWIDSGGKRFRPFVTLAAYVAGRHGAPALSPGADVASLIPAAVTKVAAAIEILHKASLVHDDIEDDDVFRYGCPTLYKAHGLGPALNVGDYLIGLGYRLISAQAHALGADRVADILAHLSGAHLELCRGQGAELFWQQRTDRQLRPIDALSIYAQKTAPAFETALYAGLRAADAAIDRAALRQFAAYLGEAYQVLNDLDDWRGDERNKVLPGLDGAAERPTLLRAFALEAGGAARLAAASGDPQTLRRVYEELGALDKAERLVDKLRGRATDLADRNRNPALRDLLRFIVNIVL